jgi:lycopene cyclase domain-containing protein
MDKFFTIYPVLLIPFFVVNGILTGSVIEQPVVWYNNQENLGIRLFTIPVEDIFYGLELMVLTILFYENFKYRMSRYEK